MVDVAELSALLRSGGTTWATARGVVRHHRRQDLVTVGFERHFAGLEQDGWRVGPAPDEAVAAALADPREIETVSAFAATSTGRRRVDVLSRRGEEWLAQAVVVDGDTWWARTDDGVVTNHGDPAYQHGGTDELDLLTPSRVELGYELEPTPDRERVAGRDCTVVIAVPRSPRRPARTPGTEVFAMITGGDRFRLRVDVATGTVLKVVKLVDGAVAETVEFTEIEFDVPLPDDTFAPIT